MADLVSSLTTGFTSMASEAIGAIGDVVPVVLPIMAAIIVIGVVIKVVRKIAGR